MHDVHDLRSRRYLAGGSMAPHCHQESSFTVVLDGSYREHIRGRDQEHKPGAMLFYPAGETHSQSFGPAGSRKLIFHPSLACLSFLNDAKVPLSQAPFLRTAAVRELARRVDRELQVSDSFSAMVMDGALLELVGVFGRECEAGGHDGVIPR